MFFLSCLSAVRGNHDNMTYDDDPVYIVNFMENQLNLDGIHEPLRNCRDRRIFHPLCKNQGYFVNNDWDRIITKHVLRTGGKKYVFEESMGGILHINC